MLSTLISWYGKPAVYGFFVVLIILIAAALFVYTATDETKEESARDTAVSVARVGSLQNGRSVELIGSVEAVDQQILTAEASGRVVSVNVSLGDPVRAGQMIAELENASERAAVLQAEGAYEAALASAAQGDVRVEEAENALHAAKDNGVTAFKNAFNTFRSILLNDVDDLYTDPTGPFPGLRIEGGSETGFLNSERVRFQSVLLEWSDRVNTTTPGSELLAELGYASGRLNELALVVDTLLERLNDDDSVGIFTKQELQNQSTAFSNARASINAELSSIDTARTGILNARESLRRARIGSTDSDVSTANAQVKQALGTLRSAQANLEKTFLRTSISGTINSLSVKTGDFVTLNEVVARVANNDALEVTTYISEAERSSIAIGDTVRLAGEYDGTITNIAPAVDPDTRKIEVKIAAETDALQNGDTVRITLYTNNEEPPPDAPLTIPITALKVETDRTVVFTVAENSELRAHEVTVGPLLGSNVLIEAGLTPDMEIVTDARGFNEGDRVTLRD